MSSIQPSHLKIIPYHSDTMSPIVTAELPTMHGKSQTRHFALLLTDDRAEKLFGFQEVNSWTPLTTKVRLILNKIFEQLNQRFSEIPEIQEIDWCVDPDQKSIITITDQAGHPYVFGVKNPITDLFQSACSKKELEECLQDLYRFRDTLLKRVEQIDCDNISPEQEKEISDNAQKLENDILMLEKQLQMLETSPVHLLKKPSQSQEGSSSSSQTSSDVPHSLSVPLSMTHRDRTHLYHFEQMEFKLVSLEGELKRIKTKLEDSAAVEKTLSSLKLKIYREKKANLQQQLNLIKSLKQGAHEEARLNARLQKLDKEIASAEKELLLDQDVLDANIPSLNEIEEQIDQISSLRNMTIDHFLHFYDKLSNNQKRELETLLGITKQLQKLKDEWEKIHSQDIASETILLKTKSAIQKEAAKENMRANLPEKEKLLEKSQKIAPRYYRLYNRLQKDQEIWLIFQALLPTLRTPDQVKIDIFIDESTISRYKDYFAMDVLEKNSSEKILFSSLSEMQKDLWRQKSRPSGFSPFVTFLPPSTKEDKWYDLEHDFTLEAKELKAEIERLTQQGSNQELIKEKREQLAKIERELIDIRRELPHSSKT